MTDVGQRERETQNRVVKLLRDELGYDFLGYWEDREENANVEEHLLRDWLGRQGHSEKVIGKALFELGREKAVGAGKTLYDANREVYSLLRYGVHVRADAGEQTETIWLIDWENPSNNDFAIAEEVTVAGVHDKRPDVVLYVNGIAVGMLELKRSIVSVTEGIRQCLDSQKKEFIRPFFSTIQVVMAGNDSEGLRYGAIGTPERYFLTWKEASPIENVLDRAVSQLCAKERLLELIHDFTVFDAGIKKLCRHNQYFGVHAAQEHVAKREGGIIWHTQGSGKSLTMVWLAKWIREHVEDARVLLITDRTELDEQIEKVFKGVSEDVYRTKSGADLVSVLNRSDEWLIASLVHKFGSSEEGDIDSFIADIKDHLPAGFQPKGESVVFVDECHRTQSGKLHEAMKAILPGAMFIGFTGTPLLSRDKQKSIEIFGPYIHTYKYDEAVRDGVVLDLSYEARDIDQNLVSEEKIDQWFESKTGGLTDLAKAQVKQRWGTMRKVLSSKSRLEKIVGDIMLDMETRDRLKSGHGNALLVSGSIYQACRLYQMFQDAGLGDRCAIVTSYRPSASEIKGEESGEGLTEKLRQYEIYRKMLADHFGEDEESASGKVEEFEAEVKRRFVDEPGQMKLLIVVDKLLTGFDAPPATYLYIDKNMRDHGLFQAICRVNRLDDEKQYGYIIDYKDLFKSLARSIQEYTGEAFDGYDAGDIAGLLKNRLVTGREDLEEALEAVRALCEPVEQPRESGDYQRFFCGSDSAELKENESKRVALYKQVASLLRAYAAIANELKAAGYSAPEAAKIKADVDHFEKVRQEIKLASADYVDMKMFEPAMRHLIDRYIGADESEKISVFDDLTLVDLIVERGEDAFNSLPAGIRANPEAMAETIQNNVRKVIIDERAANPVYFDKMSALLDAVIQARKKDALSYKEYLAKVVEVAKRVKQPEAEDSYPSAITPGARRALYDNLGRDEDAALRIDAAIRGAKRADWRGNRLKEREIRIAIKQAVGGDAEVANRLLEIAKAQHDY